MAVTVAALLLALQVLGPFDSGVGPFDSGAGPFDSGQRPWTRDVSENVVRRVHRGPFEGQTTLWVRLAPRAKDPKVSPSSFVLVAEVEGKHPRTRPAVTLHVATDVRFYPLIARVARLHMTIDGDRPIDFLAPGEPTSIGYCCDDVTIPTNAIAALSADRLDRLATATTVSGDILGVPFVLDSSQLKAIAEFRRNIVPDSR